MLRPSPLLADQAVPLLRRLASMQQGRARRRADLRAGAASRYAFTAWRSTLANAMKDLFEDKAADWDRRPTPQQISEGVFAAVMNTVALSPTLTVMDFGAGTGLVCGKLAPHVGRVLAVDVSPAMLDQLAKKPELAGKVEVFCQDILATPLGRQVDLVVSAMVMHHVADIQALFRALLAHLVRAAGSRWPISTQRLATSTSLAPRACITMASRASCWSRCSARRAS